MPPNAAEYLSEIATTNLWGTLRAILLEHLRPYLDREDVVGLAVLGGAADTAGRRFLDRFSDLDSSMFISVPSLAQHAGQPIRQVIDQHQDRLPEWLPPFEIRVPCAEHADGFIEINIHQQVIELEEDPRRQWDEMRKEAYVETAELLVDRGGRLSRLIQAKTAWDDVEARRMLLRVLGQLHWYGAVNPIRQIERGFFHNGHDLLNHAMDLLIHAVYLINRKYRPHPKWRLQRTFFLPLLPERFRERIQAAMLVRAMDAASIRERVALVKELTADITALARGVYSMPENSYEASVMESFDDRQLRREIRGPKPA